MSNWTRAKRLPHPFTNNTDLQRMIRKIPFRILYRNDLVGVRLNNQSDVLIIKDRFGIHRRYVVTYDKWLDIEKCRSGSGSTILITNEWLVNYSVNYCTKCGKHK